jgi:hypothetical protein
VRALGLIVSQGETKHMLSALLRLTFNTIYKLLKNHVSFETRAFEVFANNFQFFQLFWTDICQTHATCLRACTFAT